MLQLQFLPFKFMVVKLIFDRYSPVFVYPPNYWKNDNDVPKEGTVQRMTFFEALNDVVYQPKRSAKEV